MIVKSEAVEPKAGSATSVYPAVIVNVLDSDPTSTTINLQVFCPSVMSGDLFDAKNCQTNWIKAPRYPHKNADAYDYKLGGIVMISYQNGNVDSPLFVRYVVISDEILNRNASYVDGSDITVDSLFDVGDTSLTLTSPGIQKGVALLPILNYYNNAYSVLHSYLYTGDIISIMRCGKYGLEMVSKIKPNNDVNYTYTYTDNLYLDSKYANNSSLKIFKYLIDSEITEQTSNVIDIFNSTIKSLGGSSTIEPQFDSTNEADVLFVYALLAGLTYSPNNDSTDMSSILHPLLFNKIKKDKLNRTTINEGSNFGQILRANYSDIASTNGCSIYQGSVYINSTQKIEQDKLDKVFNFIHKLWANINTDYKMHTRIASRFAIIITNNIVSMKTQYKCKTLANKALIIIATVASTFRVIEPVLSNLSLYSSYFEDNNLLKDLHMSLISDLKSDEYTKLTMTSEDIAKGLATLYFKVLYDKTTDDYFEEYENPLNKIAKSILSGINYINSNYDSLITVLTQNEDEE